ncbi:hypothetical protein LZD49_30900 [Dyadobacter sp. CY261]|uniref:hypothetical protein n=1 Tax=Dyadobacter sp. CY261 TaxID=2907203 RepID=UPI001F3EE368|nr:hypothetical protein [Dyadobacter sp. CY261]MCF0074934.1 hypothetical protein [Dyadobacter sp. CY261]
MKNLFVSAAFILFSLSMFSCENSNEPLPYSGSGTKNAVDYQSTPATTNAMQVGNPITNKAPLPNGFEWKMMKTVTVPLNKGLNLSSPFSIVNEDAGDISWGSDGGCYQAIKCWKVGQVNLKIVDVKTVSPDYLKTLTFVKGQVSHAPAGSYSWTDYMPVGTVIAYKTSLGKYQLVVVKHVFPLILDIYHEDFYRIY